jgi:hypothetical protein
MGDKQSRIKKNSSREGLIGINKSENQLNLMYHEIVKFYGTKNKANHVIKSTIDKFPNQDLKWIYEIILFDIS